MSVRCHSYGQNLRYISISAYIKIHAYYSIYGGGRMFFLNLMCIIATQLFLGRFFISQVQVHTPITMYE